MAEAIGNSVMGLMMALGMFYAIFGHLPPPFDKLL